MLYKVIRILYMTFMQAVLSLPGSNAGNVLYGICL